MAQSWAESNWKITNHGRFINQLLPNIIRSIRQFERINKKTRRQKNVYYVQTNIYIYIYIYTHTHTHTVVGVCFKFSFSILKFVPNGTHLYFLWILSTISNENTTNITTLWYI